MNYFKIKKYYQKNLCSIILHFSSSVMERRGDWQTPTNIVITSTNIAKRIRFLILKFLTFNFMVCKVVKSRWMKNLWGKLFRYARKIFKNSFIYTTVYFTNDKAQREIFIFLYCVWQANVIVPSCSKRWWVKVDWKLNRTFRLKSQRPS